MTPGKMFPQHSFVINILCFIKIMMGTQNAKSLTVKVLLTDIVGVIRGPCLPPSHFPAPRWGWDGLGGAVKNGDKRQMHHSCSTWLLASMDLVFQSHRSWTRIHNSCLLQMS